MTVVAFTLEEQDFEVRAKFVYFTDTQDIYIMPPLPVHEQPAVHLAKALNKFMEAIPYDKLLINTTMHLNYRIQNKDLMNIPDLHLTITAQPPEDIESDEMVVVKPVSKWLSNTCDGHQDIDYTFIISFKERIKWHQPKEEDTAIQQLHSAPTLDYKDFIPSHIKKSLRFGPVEIKSHTWIDISKVCYSIYKHGTDSHFNFNNKDASTFTEGTLYPMLQMGDVECMLDNAAESLKGYIVSLMEGMGLEETLNSISSMIYLTAYCYYLDWCYHKYDKHKTMHVAIQQPSSSKSTSTRPTNSSSIMTTSSSSDPTTCPLSGTMPASSSTGLLLNVQPEHSAKKSKVQLEGEGSTGEKQKEEVKVQVNGSGSVKWKGKGHQ
ncbi:uncharacterized protein BJ212DRAFT_1482373 [Suillus subaureus]|uniref:Uncharacterized protein n=1 Tax=Suillus subaureus TaxID=48587 RepID=A0A9P7JCD7_9AGAM|nr:uncharacterized protein BJ212DRAFT_1482373 [Suillus subaureus]KAG1814028.1 hypothetical protein BJ212DRAFT_1482373 [Suillus subaureus]